MDEQRYVLPSNACLSLNSSDTPRSRLPLTNSTGNAQYHTVATANIYSDQKGLQPRPPPNFSLPTLPSQPARHHPQRTSLEARRSHIRSQRAHRGSKPNPILESQQYQAYRSRQIKGDSKDQKWPDDLEDLFLEALCLLPAMGKRKFSINGKPHGRNELICIWLWLGHCESLPAGQAPDESQRRARKQISSHLQVLKDFMRGHPAFDRLFPPNNAVFGDSFKHDPSLKAIAQGRLPCRRSSQYHVVPSMKHEPPNALSPPTRRTSLSSHQQGQYLSPPHQSLRPSLFQMWMTTLRPGVHFKDVAEDATGDGKLSIRVHTYSDSIPRAVGYSMLETFPEWRTRFPGLAQLHARNEVGCDVIHVETSLELRCGSAPERSELRGRIELVVPEEFNRQAVWRCTQTLYKPADLYGASTADPRFENVSSTPSIARCEPGVGTHICVTFPVLPWAHALQRLSTMEAQFEEAVQIGAPLLTPTTARQYIDQITMFQEIFYSAAPFQPFTRKAILLWTFKKCKAGEQGLAAWRYLEPSPPRSACFSPHRGTTHDLSAAMTENFTAWATEGVPQPLHIPSTALNPFEPLDSLDGLPTPLERMAGAADMQFPFPTYGYPTGENLSFISHDTRDSDSTLVDVQNAVGGGGDMHTDQFLAGQGMLAYFDHGQSLWEAPSAVQSFDTDPAFLANYSAIPSNAGPHIWDGDVKSESWDVGDVGLMAFDALGRCHK